MGVLRLGDMVAYLFQSCSQRDQWRWKDNVVIATSRDGAVAILERHARLRPDHVYWEKFGSGRFLWNAGGVRGKMLRHTVDRHIWWFRGFIFHADSVEEAYQKTKEKFGTQ